MEGLRYIVGLPFLLLALIPILICVVYAIVSIRLIIKAKKEQNSVKQTIGQRSLIKALVALTIVLMVCYFIFN